jgi:hypothetical protein
MSPTTNSTPPRSLNLRDAGDDVWQFKDAAPDVRQRGGDGPCGAARTTTDVDQRDEAPKHVAVVTHECVYHQPTIARHGVVERPEVAAVRGLEIGRALRQCGCPRCGTRNDNMMMGVAWREALPCPLPAPGAVDTRKRESGVSP